VKVNSENGKFMTDWQNKASCGKKNQKVKYLNTCSCFISFQETSHQ